MSTKQKHRSPRQGKITLLRHKKRSSNLRTPEWVEFYLPSFRLENGRWRVSREQKIKEKANRSRYQDNPWFIQTNFGLCSKLYREQEWELCLLDALQRFTRSWKQVDWIWYWTGVKTMEFCTIKLLYTKPFSSVVFCFPLSELVRIVHYAGPVPKQLPKRNRGETISSTEKTIYIGT